MRAGIDTSTKERSMVKREDGPTLFDESEFGGLLRRLSVHYGGVVAMARRFNLDPGNLSKAMMGKRRPPARLLSCIGATVTRYYSIPVVKNDKK